MGAEEYDEWLRFYAAEPFGADIDNLRTGILAAEVHNTSGHAKTARRPADYFPPRPMIVERNKAYWDATKDAWREYCKRQRMRNGS